MEKLNCGIIQDLLMSYSDGLTADNITEMMQEHLKECAGCQKKYEELKRNRELAEETELSKGKSFGEKLRGMKYYMMGILIGLVAPIAILVITGLIAQLVSYIETMLWTYFL